MRGILASARMRRRLAWGAAFAAAAGGVASLVVLFPSPPASKEEKVSTVPGVLVPPDKPHKFVTRKRDVLSVAARFIATAVERRHIQDSWELAAPVMKEGFTKRKWTKGNIPVVPFYKIDYARWRVGYSFEKEVDLQVALFPPRRKGQRGRVRPTVFDITLQRFQRQGGPRWLVSSFLPHPAGPDEFDSSGPATFGSGSASGAKLVETPHRSLLWLLVPGSILGVLLLVVVVVSVNAVRDKLAYNAYVRERQSSS